MSALPVKNYLKELAGEPQRRLAAPGVGQPSQRPADPESRIAEARMRGIADGRKLAEAEFAARAAALEAEAAKRLADERSRWASAEAGRIQEGLVAAISELEARVADQVATILRPFLAQAAHCRALDEFKAELTALVSKGEAVKLAIAAPPDLAAAFEAQLQGTSAIVAFQPAPHADVRAIADDTVLETRVSAWLSAIERTGPWPTK